MIYTNTRNSDAARMCTFKYPGGNACARSNVANVDYCSLHYGWDIGPDEPLPNNSDFQAAFDGVTASQDGNWRGFVFPRGSKLPKVINYPVQAQDCQFLDLNLEETNFTDVIDFAGSIFRGTTAIRGVIFEKATDFAQCRFLGRTDFLNVKFRQSASFHRAIFSGQTILRVHFAGSANLNEVVFRDAVTIAGWRNVTAVLEGGVVRTTSRAVSLSINQQPPNLLARVKAGFMRERSRARRAWRKLMELATQLLTRLTAGISAIHRHYSRDDPNSTDFEVFGGEGHLENVLFGNAEHTSFTRVNLSKVRFRGTNVRGIRFLGVNWWQPALKRNGLYDEMAVHDSHDGAFRYRELPVLEETCRNVRVALEESRSFSVASDFYIAEMEASRSRLPLVQRHLFSVPALYRFVSNYGTSVATSLRILFYLFALHIVVTVLLTGIPRGAAVLPTLSETALRSLGLLIFQATQGSPGLGWCDALFRVAGLIQVTMVVLAFRTRIKRH